MKTIIVFLLVITSWHSFSQVENEPVTNSQFKKAQAEMRRVERKKAAKIPYLLPARVYVGNPKAFAKKKYRVLVIGDRILNLIGNSKACGFTYLKIVDQGFAGKTGSGNYYFESAKGTGCSRAVTIRGQDVSSVTLIVQISGTAQMVNKQGQKIIFPTFDIVGVD